MKFTKTCLYKYNLRGEFYGGSTVPVDYYIEADNIVDAVTLIDDYISQKYGEKAKPTVVLVAQVGFSVVRPKTKTITVEL